MKFSRLIRIVFANTLRSWRHFALSAFGIVVGIGAFVFFLGLSMGVENVVLKIFPLNEVEVHAPRTTFMGTDTTKKIDDRIVDIIRRYPDVKLAIPRMALVAPARGKGWFGKMLSEGDDGSDATPVEFEVGGFCDGIDAEFMKGEPWTKLFQDWETPTRKLEQKPCGPAPNYECGSEYYYCNVDGDMMCHHRVPVVISQSLLELYNGSFASTHDLPRIPSDVAAFIAQRGPSRMSFDIRLGDTMVQGSARNIAASKRRTVEAILIGLSKRAIRIGMTVPIQYVKRWNTELVGEEAATSYSTVMVTMKNKNAVAPFAAWLEKKLDLRARDQLGKKFSTAIFVVTLLFMLISVVIVIISAINIAHNFFMQVSERRKEIGVLRAVGATQADVRRIVLGEAALIGLVGGFIGVGTAMAGGAFVDWMSMIWLPDFPFKPSTYFDFQWWILAGGLVFSVIFCVGGGFLPARRAAKMPPAQALAQN